MYHDMRVFHPALPNVNFLPAYMDLTTDDGHTISPLCAVNCAVRF